MNRCHVALATDHCLVGDSIEALLARSADLLVTARSGLHGGHFEGAAADIGLVLPMLGELQSCLGGSATSSSVRRRILIADPRERFHAREALRSGYSGVLLTTMPAALLTRAIAVVHAGGEWIEKTSVLRSLHRDLEDREDAVLTGRERQIAELVTEGLRNRQIAATMGISEATVKVHMKNIFSKLDVDSRTRLTIVVRSFGLSRTSPLTSAN